MIGPELCGGVGALQDVFDSEVNLSLCLPVLQHQFTILYVVPFLSKNKIVSPD